MSAAHVPELPGPGEPCPHCDYYHFKSGGHLKYYVGALVCPVYVQLVMAETETWGLRVRRAPQHGRERGLARCNAPEDFRCYHKGDPDGRGKRRCYSPDGFTTEIPEDKKLMIVSRDGDLVADLNEELVCPHIGTWRRPPVKKSGNRARSHGGSKKATEASFNEMPATGDPRRQAVYTELFSRVEYLRDRGLPVTPKTVAAMAGHASWRNSDIHGT
jgi:hypothetical protein